MTSPVIPCLDPSPLCGSLIKHGVIIGAVVEPNNRGTFSRRPFERRARATSMSYSACHLSQESAEATRQRVLRNLVGLHHFMEKDETGVD